MDYFFFERKKKKEKAMKITIMYTAVYSGLFDGKHLGWYHSHGDIYCGIPCWVCDKSLDFLICLKQETLDVNECIPIPIVCPGWPVT